MIDKSLEVMFREAIPEAELNEINALRQELERDGIFCKIDPGTVSGVTARENGKLVGYMTADGFNGFEVEASALTRSVEVWEAMAERLVRHAREAGAFRVLFIADPGDCVVTRKLSDMGLAPSHGEYWMELDPAAFNPVLADGVAIRDAVADDIDIIFALDRQAFRDDGDDITTEDLNNTRIISHGGCPVGKLRVVEADGIHGIYGVVIDGKSRGRGIGGQALSLVLVQLLKQSAKCIYLEVDFGNDAAFGLYKKLGFAVKKQFRYYPYTLPAIINP